MRIGRRLGVDVGAARIGLATCDPEGILATPVETLPCNGGDLRKAVKHVCALDVIEVIVGLPLNMDGTEGKSARMARRWARCLAKIIAPIPVRLVDERLTTVTAHSQLFEAGMGSREHRSVVDQVAATVILESALDFERHNGEVPGELVVVDSHLKEMK